MKTNLLPKLSISAIAALAIVGNTSNAALYVSEGFDYSSGTVDNSQNGGTGMTGAWNGSTTNIMYSIDTSNAIDVSGITGLTATAGKLQRNSAPGAAQISRGLDGTATTNLTADNSTIYFSIILENNRHSTGNANDSFIISSLAVPIGTAGNDPIDIAGGEGFGVAFTGQGVDAGGSIDIRAIAIDDGVGAKSTGLINDPGSGGVSDGGDAYFIVGKIDWVANGGSDTLTLYNVTDTTAALPTAFATITADIDNGNINTLAFAGEQIGAFDEIRIGTELADVGVVPEPSSTALLGLGGLALILRRRK
jgi:hypothetical protein